MLRAGTTIKDDIFLLMALQLRLLIRTRVEHEHASRVDNGMATILTKLSLKPTVVIAATAVCVACGADRVTGPPPAHTSQIEVRYVTPLSVTQQGLVTAAVSRWSRAVSKDMGDFAFGTPANYCFPGEPPLHGAHHNLLVFISVDNLDGLHRDVAFTEICAMSGRDTLPVIAHISFDAADLDSLEVHGQFASVITHELGHALGFNPQSYVTRGLTAGGATDPVFTGTKARAEFGMHGAWYTAPTVPLEDNNGGRGPNDPHWRLSVFGDELMVSSFLADYKSPLSTITLGFFQDLGYTVDFSVADPYEVVPLFGGDRQIPIPDGTLRNDFVVRKPPTFVSPLAAP